MRLDEDIFTRIATARNRRRAAVFVRRESANETELRRAGQEIGLQMPESYLQFCSKLGMGDFNEELRLVAPSELYRFDIPGVEFDGFVAFATDDLGNYLAFNPLEQPVDDEISVYYCCHDPFGFGVVAPSFGVFIQEFVGKDFNYESLVEVLPSFKEVEPPRMPVLKKPWWKVW